MINEKTNRSRFKKTTLAVTLAAVVMSSVAMPGMAAQHDNRGRNGDIRWNSDRHDNRNIGRERVVVSERNVRRVAPYYRMHDDRSWRKGRWERTRYNGRYGWYWIVGNDYRYYDQPVYPYPVNPYANEVVYAPPVVVTPPPQPSSGINFVFPLNFR